MSEEIQNNTKKIVVDAEIELTDLLKQIAAFQGDRIILTFVDNSDLLVSAVNFKVLLESADELDKALVAQIVQNPAGQRNATTAGMVVTSSSNQIPETLWDQAFTQLESRKSKLGSTLRSSNYSHEKQHAAKDETVDSMRDSVLSSHEEVEHSADIVDNSNSETDPADRANLSQFQQKVKNALDRSKRDITNGFNTKTVSQGGVTVALDHAIASAPASAAPAKLIGRDFLGPRDTAGYVENQPVTPQERRLRSNNKFSKGSPAQLFSSIFQKIGPLFKGKNYKKIGLFIGVPLLLILLFVGFYIYQFTPFTKVDVYIESRPVNAELTFTGDPSVTSFSMETQKIPVKKETVEKEISDSAQATGVAVRGTQAGGVVRILCYLDPSETPSITIAQGTTLTDQSGKAFITLGQVFVECPGQQSATVQAVEVGSEYNLSAGARFTVQGYAFEDVNGTNLTSFSGGTQEEYTVVSQGDYDNLIADLKTTAFQDAKGDLERRASDGWIIISSTVKDTLDGEPTLDAAVGTETDVINASIKTSSTALYYKKNELEEMADDLLLESAQEQNLFESDSEITLKLDDNIVKNIRIEGVDDTTNTVTAIITVSGIVKPEVDKNSIAKELTGNDWDKGLKYLGDLEFVSKPTTVKFTPEWFPKSLRYFPNRQGRIQVTIHEVEKTPEAEPAPESPAPTE